MKEKTQFNWCGLQVIEELPFIGFDQTLGRFYFDKNPALHQKVGSVVTNISSAMLKTECDLAPNHEATVLQFSGQRIGIDGLEKAIPKLLVNKEKGIQKRLAEP